MVDGGRGVGALEVSLAEDTTHRIGHLAAAHLLMLKTRLSQPETAPDPVQEHGEAEERVPTPKEELR